jgi:hypothetical protein
MCYKICKGFMKKFCFVVGFFFNTSKKNIDVM